MRFRTLASPPISLWPDAEDMPVAGIWHHRPTFIRDSRARSAHLVAGLFTVLSVLIVGAACCFAILLRSEPLLSLLAIAMFGIPAAVAAFISNFAGREAALIVTDADLKLRDDGRDADVVIEVAVSVNDRVVARDRGVLRFEENEMYFSGHSFSFLVGPQDLSSTGRTSWSRRTKNSVRIELRHSSLRVELELLALRGGPWNWREMSRFLAITLATFQRLPPTSARRQYPPLEPWPEAEPA